MEKTVSIGFRSTVLRRFQVVALAATKLTTPHESMSAVTKSSGQVSHGLSVLSVLPRFAFGPVGAVAIAGLWTGWPTAHPAMVCTWVLLASYAMFCWTSCFHEAVHHTLGGSKTFSILVGRFIGTMIFVPFHVYRDSHIRHHAYLNKAADWELWPYSDPNASLWFRRIFCWLEIPFGFFTSPYVYSRLYFHPDSQMKDPVVRRAVRNEYIAIVLVWSSIFAAVTWFQVWPQFLLAWVLPHWVASVYQTFRKYSEHLGMSSYDPLLGTRTVIGDSLITRLCTYLNFDIFVHGPHHRHPRFRHDALCERMKEYQETHKELQYPVFKSYRAALIDLAPAILFNPGVGVNAGAPQPAAEKNHDISDFGEDVTAEILSSEDAVVSS